jgi:hypothetical protein
MPATTAAKPPRVVHVDGDVEPSMAELPATACRAPPVVKPDAHVILLIRSQTETSHLELLPSLRRVWPFY